jgi:hypothetical protein
MCEELGTALSNTTSKIAEAELFGVPTGITPGGTAAVPPTPPGLSNMVTSVISAKDWSVDILLFHIF